MKDFAMILIALGGLGTAAWALKFEKPRLEAEIESLQADVKEAKAELKTATKELASAKKAAASRQADSGSTTVASVDTGSRQKPGTNEKPAPPAKAEAAITEAAIITAKTEKLAELEAVHKNAIAEIGAKEAILDKNEVGAKKSLSQAELAFKQKNEELGEFEVSTIVDSNGRVRERSRGKRVSDADRNKVLAPLTKEITRLKQLITAIEEARLKLRADKSAAEKHYADQFKAIHLSE